MNSIKIIAEIGCNHKGDFNIAKKMITTAANLCKVDIVKFQKRNPKELLTKREYNKAHCNPIHSYASTYGKHREFLEFSIEQHAELKKICEDNNLIYSSSVWDLSSAKNIVSLHPKIIKIPSACNLNKSLLSYLCEYFEGEIHLSIGMTTHQEEELIVSYFENMNRNKDLIIYACTSGYPIPYNEVYLSEISRLKKKYTSRVKSIGFSGHHLGISIDIAAVVLGAEFIERHFTLDRTWKGTDQAFSLEPESMSKLIRDIDAVRKALEFTKDSPSSSEIQVYEKLKKNQIRWIE